MARASTVATSALMAVAAISALTSVSAEEPVWCQLAQQYVSKRPLAMQELSSARHGNGDSMTDTAKGHLDADFPVDANCDCCCYDGKNGNNDQESCEWELCRRIARFNFVSRPCDLTGAHCSANMALEQHASEHPLAMQELSDARDGHGDSVTDAAKDDLDADFPVDANCECCCYDGKNGNNDQESCEWNLCRRIARFSFKSRPCDLTGAHCSANIALEQQPFDADCDCCFLANGNRDMDSCNWRMCFARHGDKMSVPRC